jgi:hypothetical protein
MRDILSQLPRKVKLQKRNVGGMMGTGGNGVPMRAKAWHIHFLVLLVYILFVLALTWPLAANFGSHVPGNGADDPPLTWNLWWVQHALLNLGTNPFDCDYLFYPLGINLAFYTLTVLNGLLSIPLQAAVGLIPASNLLLLSSFVLGGYGAFLLAHHLLSRRRAVNTHSATALLWTLFPPFAAGLVYAFSSSKMAYAALGQWNIASSQWIPYFILYLYKSQEAPNRLRYPLLAGLFLLLQAYAELTYASFLLLFTALWALWQIGLGLRRPGTWRLVGNLLIVAGIGAIGLTPILAMMLPDLLMEGAILAEGGGFADVFSADLLGFLVPSSYHPLLGTLIQRFRFDYSVGQHLYLGYSVFALALLAVWFGRRRTSPAALPGVDAPPRSPTAKGTDPQIGFWILSTLTFWLLSLGPSLRINGQDTGLPLPFALIAQLPFFEGNRYPSRYSVLLFLSLSMLMAFGLSALLRRSRNHSHPLLRLTSVLLVALFLFEHLSVPLPLSDMRVPPVYSFLAEEMPGDFTLLDLPVAWRNGFRVTGTQHPIIMFEQYYQSVHGKRLLAGNTSRNPPLKFQYFAEAPVTNSLIALETGHSLGPATIERDRALAADVLRFFDIQAIVVHPAYTGPEIVPYIEGTFPVEEVYADAETTAYRTDLPPWPEVWIVEPGDDLSTLSYAEGWGAPASDLIWAQRKAARLLVPLNGSEQKISLRAYSPAQGQALQLEAMGELVAEIDMAPGWGDYELFLPQRIVQPGLNELWLRLRQTVPAHQVQVSPRVIGGTGASSPVNLVVRSAGQEVGDFGHIYVNGQEVSPNERGYNIAILDSETGTVARAAAFDTHLDEGASKALAAFLNEAAPGSIVAVAASDEASRLLGQEAVDALRSIGAQGDMRARYRWSHAIIGVKGAPAGSALEAMEEVRPVSLVVGEGATEPHLAAGFDSIRFQALSSSQATSPP